MSKLWTFLFAAEPLLALPAKSGTFGKEAKIAAEQVFQIVGIVTCLFFATVSVAVVIGSMLH